MHIYTSFCSSNENQRMSFDVSVADLRDSNLLQYSLEPVSGKRSSQTSSEGGHFDSEIGKVLKPFSASAASTKKEFVSAIYRAINHETKNTSMCNEGAKLRGRCGSERGKWELSAGKE